MDAEFEILDHTADIGVIAYGADLKEAFINAARGMFSIITDTDGISTSESRTISLESSDSEELLVAWLNELIYLFDTENLVFAGFDITHLDKISLSAVICGQKIDPANHEIRTGIKAATYHMLEIDESDAFRVRILFDI